MEGRDDHLLHRVPLSDAIVVRPKLVAIVSSPMKRVAPQEHSPSAVVFVAEAPRAHFFPDLGLGVHVHAGLRAYELVW